MSGSGKQAMRAGGREDRPSDVHFVEDAAPEITDAVAPPSVIFEAATEAPNRSGTILKLAALIGLLWLALSCATIFLLIDNRAQNHVDLVEWAAVITAVSAPLALIGIGAVVAMRMEAARGATMMGHAQALFDDASDRMRGEVEQLRAALSAMRTEIILQRAEVDQQTQKLLAASTGFSQQLSQTSSQIAQDSATLVSHATALDQAAASARADLGVIMSDLPKVETLARSVSDSFRTIGSEALGQAASLEAGLAQLGSRADATQDSVATASQRLAAQIAQVETATERAREQLEMLAGRLNESVDSALSRTAEAVETTRTSVDAQSEALLGTVDAARNALAATGTEAIHNLRDGFEQLTAQFGQLETRISAQDNRVRSLIAHLGSGLVELEAQLGALGTAGEAQAALLTQSIARLQDELAALSGPLGRNDEDTTRLVEHIGQLQAMLKDVEQLSNGKLSENLVAVGDIVSQARTALLDAQTDITALDERLGNLREAADAVKAATTNSVETLDTSLSGVDDRVAALASRLEESHAQLRAIESESENVGFNASSTLLDTLGRARDAATQAADHIRNVLSGVTDEIHAALARANQETLKTAVDEAIAGRIAALKTTSEEAIAAAQTAAERLARQMLTIADTTASVEARISEVNAQVEQQNQEEFSRRSALLIESLNSTAIDIAKIMSNEVTDIAWAAYLKGDRSVFARRAVRLLDAGEIKAIQRHYEQEPEFREQVNRYIHDFEAVIRRVLAERDGGPMAVAMLSSDVGKLYVALAQSIDRLRTA